VTIGNSLQVISVGAFSNNLLTSVTIPSNVNSIGNYAFTANSLTSVTIPSTVLTIGQGAFRNNSSLTTVNCYTTYTAFVANNAFFGVGALTIHARISDNTWTAAPSPGVTFQGKTGVIIIKDLT